MSDSSPNYISTVWASAYVLFTNIALAKTSNLTKSNIKVGKGTFMRWREGSEYLLNNNLLLSEFKPKEIRASESRSVVSDHLWPHGL